MNVWGIHMGEHVGTKPIEDGYVAIGWDQLGDLRKIEATREGFKDALSTNIPSTKEGAIPVHAGVLYRFLHEIKNDDFVVYPSKVDRMVNVGKFVGEYSFVEGDADGYPNHHSVKWLGSYPRSDFRQTALHEIGSAITLFMVRRHVAEFLSKANIQIDEPIAEDVISEEADDDTATIAVSRQAEETTQDYIIRRIKTGLDAFEFEHFVAHVLECMGYTARVSEKSGDGGVDVIAHNDELGFEPPIIKVQCKQITGQNSEPEVSQLLGTLGDGEFALFVNLGSYSRPARVLERNRAKLRLIDGDQLVELILEHYPNFSPKYRSLFPLKQIYVPDPAH